MHRRGHIVYYVIFHWGNFSKVVCFSYMRNFSQFKGGGWLKWRNGKYAYDGVQLFICPIQVYFRGYWCWCFALCEDSVVQYVISVMYRYRKYLVREIIAVSLLNFCLQSFTNAAPNTCDLQPTLSELLRRPLSKYFCSL